MKSFFYTLILIYISLLSSYATLSDEKLLLWEAADEGVIDAQYKLAEIYRLEAFEADFFEPDRKLLEKAVRWYEAASEKEHLASKYQLLDIYSFYLGLNDKWLILVKDMAEKGNLTAQYELAKYYEFLRFNKGEDIQLCLHQSLLAYEKLLNSIGSKSSFVHAKSRPLHPDTISRNEIQNKITELQQLDPLVEEKRIQLKRQYDEAVEKEDWRTIVQMADLWAESENTKLKKAQQAYELAAENNYVPAQIKLSEFIFQRVQTIEDYYEAYFWASLAKENNEESAEVLVAKILPFIPIQFKAELDREIYKAIEQIKK